MENGEEAGFLAYSTGGQISSRLLSMRSAVALLELPQVTFFHAFDTGRSTKVYSSARS